MTQFALQITLNIELLHEGVACGDSRRFFDINTPAGSGASVAVMASTVVSSAASSTHWQISAQVGGLLRIDQFAQHRQTEGPGDTDAPQ
jgi:hypothetical protein